MGTSPERVSVPAIRLRQVPYRTGSGRKAGKSGRRRASAARAVRGWHGDCSGSVTLPCNHGSRVVLAAAACAGRGGGLMLFQRETRRPAGGPAAARQTPSAR